MYRLSSPLQIVKYEKLRTAPALHKRILGDLLRGNPVALDFDEITDADLTFVLAIEASRRGAASANKSRSYQPPDRQAAPSHYPRKDFHRNLTTRRHALVRGFSSLSRQT
jgi:hypothetical protein